ncbi:MAG: HAMP domain-containing protein [Clostridia bacterium]|nr:HAMP domain-containing protein [Clostridia bacterium]
MEKIKEKLKSVRVRLFITLCAVIMFLVLCLITINSLVLENFYMYSKTKTIKEVYQKINQYYAKPNLEYNLENELKKIAFRNNFDILIKTDTNLILFSTDKDFLDNLNKITEMTKIQSSKERANIIYTDENMEIRKIADSANSLNYILLTGNLVNGYSLYIRIPIAPIEESVRISNEVLVLIGLLTIIVSSFAASLISRKFTEPILQLNEITNQMAKLDFSKKYRITDSDDEINKLGKNINTMSDKLETTINQLRENNKELEKDIEEKSKIDEMRKQFISDVSHELKTPIALIQGYAEGLVENVNNDEESKKFYAEVILDESNKMDKLVKQLLELMKLEYGKREFNDEKFDLVELIKEVIRKCNVMLEENEIEVIFEKKEPIYVYADDFYIDQIVTNYFTNAIKHAEVVDGKKQIQITIEQKEAKVRVFIFNTGKNIEEENLDRIWGRFYKVDSSRNRGDGGSGIGLALVKAIQTNYQNAYGVVNKEDGVEFYFDINKEKSRK